MCCDSFQLFDVKSKKIIRQGSENCKKLGKQLYIKRHFGYIFISHFY